MYIKKGSLFQRKDKRWEARLYIDGVQRTIACCKLKATAYEKLKSAVNNLKQGKKPEPKKSKTILFFDWLEIWFDTYKKPELSQSGLKNIECNIRLHLKPNFENCDIKKITAIEIKNTLNLIESSKIKQYVYDIFNESLRNAYQNDLIKKNVCELLKRPQHETEKGIPLTLDEQAMFLKEVAKTRFKNYYLFLLFTGCRPAEPLLIKKSNVNISNNTIYVPGTKTKLSKRYLPIFDFLKPVIEKQLDESKTEYLFDFTKDSIKRDFKKIKNIAPCFSLKTLRHTFATRMFEAGVNIKIISQWLGHSSIRITEQIYIDVIRQFEHKIVLENATCFDTCFLLNLNFDIEKE